MAWLSGCSNSDHAKKIPNTLSFHHSIILSVSSLSISSLIRALLNSSTKLCFIDTKFNSCLHLPRTLVTPHEVVFINGTTSMWATDAVWLSIWLSAMALTDVLLVITNLDPSCDVVLQMNWLYQHNPLVDWTTGQITPWPSSIKEDLTLKTTPISALASTQISIPLNKPVPQVLILSSSAVNPNQAWTLSLILSSVLSEPKILFVNGPAFTRDCRLCGSQTFSMTLLSNSAHVASALFNVPDTPQEDLLSVLEQYRNFADVFSKKKVDTLTLHQPYDLKINLVDGTSPLPGMV